jgi:hypothetical protein
MHARQHKQNKLSARATLQSPKTVLSSQVSPDSTEEQSPIETPHVPSEPHHEFDFSRIPLHAPSSTAATSTETESIDPDEQVTSVHTSATNEPIQTPHPMHLSNNAQPLEEATRAFMEPHFGHSFGRVRLHTDERATHIAQAVDARAFTLGQDICFGAGAYQLDSPRGQTLLAHELTHTIQQSTNTGPVPDTLTALHISQPDEPLEREAETIAQAVGSGEKVPEITHHAQYLIQRVGPDDLPLPSPSTPPQYAARTD